MDSVFFFFSNSEMFKYETFCVQKTTTQSLSNFDSTVQTFYFIYSSNQMLTHLHQKGVHFCICVQNKKYISSLHTHLTPKESIMSIFKKQKRNREFLANEEERINSVSI